MLSNAADSRLKWDPAMHNNITSLPFVGASFASPEESEIWLPELTVYNTLTAIASSLDTSLATVSHTGDVFWSRPGALDLACKFSGLVAFPFDKLRCDFEVGGSAYWNSVCYEEENGMKYEYGGMGTVMSRQDDSVYVDFPWGSGCKCNPGHTHCCPRPIGTH